MRSSGRQGPSILVTLLQADDLRRVCGWVIRDGCGEGWLGGLEEGRDGVVPEDESGVLSSEASSMSLLLDFACLGGELASRGWAC